MRSGKKKGSSPASKRTRTVARPKSAPSKATSQAKRSAPKSPAQAKRQTKTPPKKATSKIISKPNKTKNTQSKRAVKKKEYVKPMALMPITIKDYRDKNGGHHHVIVDNIEDKHVSVGLTQDKYKGKNATNYKCQTSPLGDGKQSYMRRQAQVAPQKEYYNPRGGMMELGDYQRAQEYGDRAKKKHLEKNCKKNSNEVPNA